MKNIALLAFLLFIAYVYSMCNIERNNCTYKNLNRTIERVESIFERFIENDKASIEALNDLADKVDAQWENVTESCGRILNGLVRDTVTRNRTIFTKDCNEDENTREWKEDPCCNPDLQEEQCCKAKLRREENEFIRLFNETNVRQCCNDGKNVKLLLKSFRKEQLKNEKRCRNRYKKEEKKIRRKYEVVETCFNEIFSKGKFCESDSECPGDQACNLLENQCTKLGRGSKNATRTFVKCILKEFPRDIRESLNENLNLPDNVTPDQVVNKISKNITRWICVSNDGFGIADHLRNRTACENKMICNDGSGMPCKFMHNNMTHNNMTHNNMTHNNMTHNNMTQPGEAFCGFGCVEIEGQGPKKYSCAGALPNQFVRTPQQCAKFGECTGKKFSDRVNITECTNEFVCSDFLNGTRDDCFRRKRCRGYPFRNAICAKRPNSKTGRNKCDMNWDFEGELGFCFREYDPEWPRSFNRTHCDNADGRWVKVPDNKHDCEKYKRCQIEGRDTFLNETECRSCKGNPTSYFKSGNNTWIRRKFRVAGTWVNKTNVPQYKWVQTIDLEAVYDFVFEAVESLFSRAAVTELMCIYNPLFKSAEKLACSCGRDAVNGTDCFTNNRKQQIGFYKFLKNSEQDFEVDGAHIKSNNSFNNNQDVKIFKEQIHLDTQAPTNKRSISHVYAVEAINVYTDSSRNAIVGSVLGHGSALGTTPNAAVTLCVSRQNDFVLGQNTHSTPALVTRSGNYYYKSSVTITSSDANQICGSVSDTNSYYPALVLSNNPNCNFNTQYFDGSACQNCECDATGASATTCTATGVCTCKENWSGNKCNVKNDDTPSSAATYSLSLVALLIMLITYLF